MDSDLSSFTLGEFLLGTATKILTSFFPIFSGILSISLDTFSSDRFAGISKLTLISDGNLTAKQDEAKNIKATKKEIDLRLTFEWF